MAKSCEKEGCDKQPTYAEKGAKSAMFCKDHKEADMVNVKHKRCERGGCDKQPTYAEKGDKSARFCKDHKEPDMVNVVSKKCERDGCDKIPNFAEAGAKTASFCKDHKEPYMVDIVHKICERAGCDKRPVYAEAGAKNERFCREHKEPDMVDVVHKSCERAGCDKQPTYAEKGGKSARFCKDHKEPDMVDVVNKRCERAGCDKQPVYAEAGAKNARFCREHKEHGMVNIKDKSCQEPGCSKIQSFALAGAARPLFCRNHCKTDMVDVVHNKCQQCCTVSMYGDPGNAASTCAKHRTAGMIAFPRKRCAEGGCNALGTHGKIDGSRNSARYCEAHAPVGGSYVDVVQRRCTSCGMLDVLRLGLCGDCDPVARRKYEHAKENRIRDVFLARGLAFASRDNMVDGGTCYRYRPDFVFDAGTHFVVVEVDENQHISYPEACEKTRMLAVWQSLGLPTAFVRYNPDAYMTKDGSRGKMPTKKREDVLCSWVSHLMEPGGNPAARGSCCEELRLFYDGHDERCVAPTSLAAIEM